MIMSYEEGIVKMKWSRYNLLFESKKSGWLLYNSASNSFVQMNKESADSMKEIIENPDMDFSNMPDMYFKLRLGGFLVDDGQDDAFVRILKMKRNVANYSSNILSLTIAPTKECNFDCYYCYEKNRNKSILSDENENNLIKFIKNHKLVNKLYIVWYGGEPLLKFEAIKSISAKIANLGIEFSADLVTNGYLLSESVIKELNNLKITSIQITIDGSKKTHNRRRPLIGGDATYDVIVENINKLMSSHWSGKLKLRVNVDISNSKEFVDVYQHFKNKFSQEFEKRLFVYPGFVHDSLNEDRGCHFDSKNKGKFIYELAQDHGINALEIFPKRKIGSCALNVKNAYVVGPDGELYKCWNDLGVESEVVGSINGLTKWNTSLIAEGMVDCSFLESEICRNCFYLPICDGGCPKLRMYSTRDKVERNSCTYFKSYIKELLEFHYNNSSKNCNDSKQQII